MIRGSSAEHAVLSWQHLLHVLSSSKREKVVKILKTTVTETITLKKKKRGKKTRKNAALHYLDKELHLL